MSVMIGVMTVSLNINDCLGTPVFWHRNFKKSEFETKKEFLKKAKNEKWIYVPVYLYDHGGMVFSTESFTGKAPHAEWDSGFLGYYYVSRGKVRKILGVKRISEKTLISVLETLREEVEAM